MRAENFIAFFTVCGFFIGATFSALKLNDPIDMLVYTFLITFFFYLLVHVVIINYLDARSSLKRRFDKECCGHRCGAHTTRSEERRVGKECRSRW